MDIVQMTIRLEPEFHKACLAKSDAAGQTLAEWIRRAMREKLEREEKSGDDGYYYPDGSRAITDEMLEEKLIKIAEKLKAQGKL